jgi:diguanylate cyclase (GGDEF)-like protein/PAS domain S-box-containing protein
VLPGSGPDGRYPDAARDGGDPYAAYAEPGTGGPADPYAVPSAALDSGYSGYPAYADRFDPADRALRTGARADGDRPPVRVPRGPARRLPGVPALILLLACLGYASGSATDWSGHGQLADFMGDFGLSAGALTAALSCLAFGCLPHARARAAWLCFGFSSLMVAIGNATWGWYEVVLRVPVPSPSLADYAFLFFAPPAILGLLLLANRPRSAAGWLCLLLDGWLIAGSLLTLSWSLALARAAAGAGSTLHLALALAYPVLDILLISMVLGLRFRSREGNRAAVHTAALALALTVLCDALFTSAAVHGSYHSGHLLDAGWFAGSMLLARAPWAGRSASGPDAAASAPGATADAVATAGAAVGGLPPRRRVATVFSALTPYAAAAVCTAGLLFNALGNREMDRFVLVCGCTVVFALLVRQGVVLLENLHLARELAHQERHFRSLVQGSSDVIMIAGPDGALHYVSAAATGVYGRDAGQLVGTQLADLVHPEDRGHVLWEVQRYLAKSPDDEPTARIECRIRSGTGEWLHVESTVSRYQDGLIFNSRDVTERVRLQAQLQHNAYHDPLTDLPNRALFTDRVRAALHGRRAGDKTGPSASGRGVTAVLYLDLDGFKAVNDTAGHQIGDELLVHAARRLQETVRAGDTVARLGGDEFAALIGGQVTRDQVRDIAERLRTAVSAPYWIGGEERGVAASIGIAYAERGIGPADLVRNADLAMYRAKRNGKGRVQLYTPELRAELVRRAELEQRLRTAVREGEFALLHQPVVDLATGEVTGLTAQPRWRTAQGGLITPAEFLRTAGGAERAARLARWSVEQAVARAATRARRPDGEPYPVTVRLPGHRLAGPGLVETVERALRRHALPPRTLVLALTGSEPAERSELTAFPFDELVRRMLALKRLGVGLSLDGVGGGAAPLSRLRKLPLDQLTLDRGVVEGVADSGYLRSLAAALLGLGRELGLITVADGVDLPEQAAVLRAAGCARGTGRLFAGTLDDTRLAAVVARPFPLPVGEGPADSGPPQAGAAGPARPADSDSVPPSDGV